MEKMCFDLNAARRRMRKIFGMVNVYHVIGTEHLFRMRL